MKLDLVPESLPERFAKTVGLIPEPLIHSLVAMLMSRSILTATRLGVFKALADGDLTNEELATRCGTDLRATQKLMRALQGIGYVQISNGAYALTPMAQKWLRPGTGHDLSDAILHRGIDMRILDQSEQYVREGTPFDLHGNLKGDDWGLYVRGQRMHASVAVPEIVDRTPLPPEATRMLDVGGGHALYSDAMCRRHEDLKAVVLDLPEAIQEVDRSAVSDRVSFEAGDVLTADLGDSRYDLVVIANLVHHFQADQNLEIVGKLARATRPGGVCMIVDFILPGEDGQIGQIAALLDFFFAVSSGGGTWTADEMLSWLKAAHLETRRPVRIRTAPGLALVIGKKV